MDAREIISQLIDSAYGPEQAQDILSALTAAGWRIVAPGEMDRETVERCAQWHRAKAARYAKSRPGLATAHQEYATALRALAEPKP